MLNSFFGSSRLEERAHGHSNSTARALLPILILLAGCNSATEPKSSSSSNGASQTTADGGSAAASSIDRVTAGPPVKKDLQLFTDQPAKVEPYVETAIHSKIAGYVQAMQCDIGDKVAKGQVLIRIHAPEYHDQLLQKRGMLEQIEAQAKQAEAALGVAKAAAHSAESLVVHAQAGVARAQADYTRLESELQRIQQLVSKGSVTAKLADETTNKLSAAEASKNETVANVESAKAKLDEAAANILKARADVDAVKAKVGVARAEITQAETMLTYTELTAPFDGVVTSRQADEGHYVQPAGTAPPLLTIANINKVKVCVSIPESEAAWVDAEVGNAATGDPATIFLASLPGGKIESRVTRTNRQLDSQSRTLSAEIDLENADLKLLSGAFVTAKILLEKRADVLVLPISAVVKASDGTRCCLVEEGKIVYRPIELGLRVGDEVEVKSGLAGNETVVLIRAGGLQAGQPVQVISKK